MSTTTSSCCRWLLAGLLVLALGGLTSCGQRGPQTFPVQGKVVFKGKGGNVGQLAGGNVRFQSIADPNLTAVGEIADDGSFALGSYIKDKGYPGVPAGEYKARVDPPEDDEEGRPLRGLIHPKYQDFDKSGLTFTVPHAGELVIIVSR
jgi:hypothetical protein